MENKKKDEDISEDDVKQAYEEIEGQAQESAAEDSSPKEKETPAPSAEDVKSVTGEKEQEQSKTVPYERFKEAQDKAAKAKEYEEFLQSNGDKVRRNPITGKLELLTSEQKQQLRDEDDLTEEDMLAFDETQIKVIDKLLNKRERQVYDRMEQARLHKEQTESYWGKARQKWPEISKPDSQLYKRADQILRDKYVQWDKSGKSYYIPPKAHYDAVRDAHDEIQEELEAIRKAEAEEKKNKTQNSFVEKKSTREPPSKSRADKDIKQMSDDEINDEMEEEFNKNIEKL